ncbi:hypothetical protein FJTKL_09667 [Diaporthe vaccinii]|uniref:DUF7587 domain-containing protein n=1 Tax=Diaporthe vaccinii TaxID=105482 RepID=A0ABR4EN90_9PEZI
MAPNPKSQVQKTGITIPPADPNRMEKKDPRFLFRGWTPSSGGNAKLNTTSAVTPHAFYGQDRNPRDKSILEIPEEKIKSEIRGHLIGRPVKSHFSSWAAYFQTALHYAGTGTHAHLAVFDTSLRRQQNVIYHVPALNAMGLTSYRYDHEYLVYGPVEGEAYTCVSVTKLRNHGMNMTVPFSKSTPKVSVKDLARARKVANVVRPTSHAMGPDLFLAAFAAELSRLLRAAHGKDCGPGWSQKDNSAILTHLSDVVDLGAELPPKKSLVNPKTYVDGFPQLKAMVDILMTIELGIERKRSEISKEPSSKTSVSPASGHKRKAGHGQVSNDFKVVEVDLQRALPLDLLEDLAKHGSTFQETLQATQKQPGSTTNGLVAKAQALKAKFVAPETRVDAVSVEPGRDTLMLGTHIDLDDLIKQAQVFTTTIQCYAESLAELQKAYIEIIETVGDDGDLFAFSSPQKPRPESPPPRQSVPLEQKPVAEQDDGSQARTKRVKKRERMH